MKLEASKGGGDAAWDGGFEVESDESMVLISHHNPMFSTA